MLFKDLHVSFFSEFLNITMPHKHRIALTKFRTKNHSLPNVLLSRGRNRLVYNARLCSTCGVLGANTIVFLNVQYLTDLDIFYPNTL